MIAIDKITEQKDVQLTVKGISLCFGGHEILHEVDLDLKSGQIALLRGGNGTGKTTLLNILSGFIAPDAGFANLQVGNKNIDLLNKSPDQLARNGIARLWQENRLFNNMTVLENVLAASPYGKGISPIFTLIAPHKVKQLEERFKNQALSWLTLLGMADRADSSCDKLSGGQQKRVAIARMLQTGAKFLLLDEPLANLDQSAIEAILSDLRWLAEKGYAILIVEHNYSSILPICNLSYTLSDANLLREELN